ncbi:MAG: MXAN_6640 family putative metalloprotease [Nocardioides sp.]
MPARFARVPLPLLLVLALAAVSLALLPATTAQGRSGPEPSSLVGVEAVAALDRVESLFDGSTDALTARRTATVAQPDVTLALRDLALARAALPDERQAEAAAYLARPTDGNADPFGNGYRTAEAPRKCSAVVCVHYVTTTADQSTPTYADAALANATAVHQRYVAAGYRAPKGDGNRGGDARPDIYLADIGDDGLYGYCTSDEPTATLSKKPWDTWAYCVLDNDYSPTQFSRQTPAENLQVTTAHEYFHAVQFAYDVAEDAWLLEATATWVEDELYDSVNDNLQYLRDSPLKKPNQSLDGFVDTFSYGAWVFFRRLTEQHPAEIGGLPSLIRDIWVKADGAAGGPDQYSLQAISSVLRQRRTTLAAEFGKFSAANRRPSSYEEGRANRYPKAPLAGRVRLSPGNKVSRVFSRRLAHLTSATYQFQPSAQLEAKSWQLRIKLDLTPKARGSVAVITLNPKAGRARVFRVRLNSAGNATKTVPFSARQVRSVEVTVANAGDRFRCFRGTRFSCQGASLDDGLVQRLQGRLVRR